MVKYLNKSILEYMSSELHVMVDRTIQYFNSVHKVFKSDERHKICAEASCIHNHYLSWTKLSNNYQLTLLFNMIRLYLPNSHDYMYHWQNLSRSSIDAQILPTEPTWPSVLLANLGIPINMWSLLQPDNPEKCPTVIEYPEIIIFIIGQKSNWYSP